jgi:hypothetical protein
MRRLLITALGTLLVYGAKPPDWGQPDHGLRIAVSMVSEDPQMGQEILFHFQNVGGEKLLVPIGVVVGKPHPLSLRPFAKTGDSKPRRIIYTALGVIAGYSEPWNLPLSPGETYTVRSPIGSWYVLDGSESLASFVSRHGQLWVELDHSEFECPAPSKLTPVPCWHGKAVSNTLQFPK